VNDLYQIEVHDGYCGWTALCLLLQYFGGHVTNSLGLGQKIPYANAHVGEHSLTNHDLSVIVTTAGYTFYHRGYGEQLLETLGDKRSGLYSEAVGPAGEYHVYAVIAPSEFGFRGNIATRPRFHVSDDDVDSDCESPSVLADNGTKLIFGRLGMTDKATQ